MRAAFLSKGRKRGRTAEILPNSFDERLVEIIKGREMYSSVQKPLLSLTPVHDEIVLIEFTVRCPGLIDYYRVDRVLLLWSIFP